MSDNNQVALIIEDDPDASDILAEIVRDKGFQPVQCETGEDGLSSARKINPMIVFLDIMLPDLDGYKICEALKLDPDTNQIPVVMVTALTSYENKVRGFRVGADFYVTKPYTNKEILDIFDRALEHQSTLISSGVESLVRFDVSSELASLKSVNELFGIILARSKLSEKEASQLRTALLEIGTNAIEWGNRYDLDKKVEITTHITNDKIEITITDEGEGFDPNAIPHAYSGGDDPTQHFAVRETLGLREGGFGILMSRGLLDEVRYNERGNSVTMVKYVKNAN